MSRDGDVLVWKFQADQDEGPEKQREPDTESFLGKSTNTGRFLNENLSIWSLSNSGDSGFDKESGQDLERNEPGNEDAANELTNLQIELWNLSQQEYYNEKKGLPKHLFSQIKKMKIGKVKKPCSICHSDFVKDEKIMKLPCSHIFHYPCVKTWLKISIFCPLCRLNLKEHFDGSEGGKLSQSSH